MADAGTILITGATGNTGSGVAATLLAEGHSVRALVRDEGKAGELKAGGADVVVGDLDRPETLAGALFAGVTKVYFVVPGGPTALQQSRNFLAAAQNAGTLPHIVRLSAFGTPGCRLIKDHLQVEEDIKGSGLPWTILAPTFFMQNTMMAAPTVKEHGAIYYDWGDGKAGMIDVRDIVDAAVAVLTSEDDSLVGERIVLTGPASIGFAEVAESLSRVLDKEVSYVAVPHEAAFEAMQGMGIPAWIAEAYVELSRGFEVGYADTTTDGVEQLTGRRPGDYERFARDYKAAFS
jgi:uncharacterized protein YbjT (DUF2867 family)